MSQETIEKIFSVSAAARLELSNIRGSVDIRPGDDNLVRVTAIKRAETGDAGNTQIEMTQTPDGTVVVTTRFPDGWWLWLIGSIPCRVDYVVKMPRNSTLRIKGVSNTVFADGLNGDFDFNTVSGDLTLQNLSGPVRINSVSGKISARNVAGSLDLSTVSGNADFRESQLTSMKAKTTSGDMGFESGLFDGPYRFSSVSGNVSLTLPLGAHCSAQLHSISGKISTMLPTSVRSYGHGDQAVDIQGGGPLVTVNSVSGNLRLRSNGNPQPTSNPTGTHTVNRREILERIERGEISPDEALVQLKG
jgi:hypothetical protein